MKYLLDEKEYKEIGIDAHRQGYNDGTKTTVLRITRVLRSLLDPTGSDRVIWPAFHKDDEERELHEQLKIVAGRLNP